MSGEWGGLRSRLEEHGLDLGGGFIFDDSRGGIGGIRRRWAARGLLDIELTVDLEKLVGLADGTFYTDYQAFVGYDGSRDIGDIQAFANIDTNRRSQLAEFWYEQWLWNKAFRFKIGRVDANSEFAFVDHGADFINSSFGITPTAFVLPTYPDPASGANFFLYPTEHISFGFGLYDGAASRGVHTGVHGPDTLDGSDLFFIGELDFKWAVGPQALPGRIGLGGWGHNGRFERFSGAFQDGTTGAYMTLDQMAWREKAAVEDDPQGIGVFFQYGYADEAVSEVADHIGAGLIWTGAFAGRDEDILGIGVTYARLSDEADFVHDHETAVEWFYKVQLTPWLALKPDVQYIINPSGGGDIDDVLVGTVRVDVVF
jgi:porin